MGTAAVEEIGVAGAEFVTDAVQFEREAAADDKAGLLALVGDGGAA